jgi:membrane protease YdiL (CAAX protease family)
MIDLRDPTTTRPPRRGDHRAAQRDLVAFAVLLAPTVVLLEGLLLADGSPLADQPARVLALMWAPALASISVRLVGRRGFGDVRFRLDLRRDRSWYLLAWLLPAALGLVAYGFGWATGIAPPSPGEDIGTVVVALAVALTVAVPISAVTAFGEELGWRGFLLPRLVDAGVPRPVAVTNVAWWGYHVALILGGVYASGRSPILAAALFGVVVASIGSVASWSRLATGSVWPAVLLHATWNAVIQGGFDELTVGEGPRAAVNTWVGESGVLLAGAALVVALHVRRSMPTRPAADLVRPTQETTS